MLYLYTLWAHLDCSLFYLLWLTLLACLSLCVLIIYIMCSFEVLHFCCYIFILFICWAFTSNVSAQTCQIVCVVMSDVRIGICSGLLPSQGHCLSLFSKVFLPLLWDVNVVDVFFVMCFSLHFNLWWPLLLPAHLWLVCALTYCS